MSMPKLGKFSVYKESQENTFCSAEDEKQLERFMKVELIDLSSFFLFVAHMCMQHLNETFLGYYNMRYHTQLVSATIQL